MSLLSVSHSTTAHSTPYNTNAVIYIIVRVNEFSTRLQDAIDFQSVQR